MFWQANGLVSAATARSRAGRVGCCLVERASIWCRVAAAAAAPARGNQYPQGCLIALRANGHSAPPGRPAAVVQCWWLVQLARTHACHRSRITQPPQQVG